MAKECGARGVEVEGEREREAMRSRRMKSWWTDVLHSVSVRYGIGASKQKDDCLAEGCSR